MLKHNAAFYAKIAEDYSSKDNSAEVAAFVSELETGIANAAKNGSREYTHTISSDNPLRSNMDVIHAATKELKEVGKFTCSVLTERRMNGNTVIMISF